MSTATRPTRTSTVPLPLPTDVPLPDWLPVTDGFWGEVMDNPLAYISLEHRRKWAATHLTDRTARCFAATCAAFTLPSFETQRTDDRRPRTLVELATRFAFGLASQGQRQNAYGASAAHSAAYIKRADYASAYASAYSAIARITQSRWLTLFLPLPVPLSEDATRMGRAWLSTYFGDGVDDRLCRAVYADALQECGVETPHVILALQELPCLVPGVCGLTMDVR